MHDGQTLDAGVRRLGVSDLVSMASSPPRIRPRRGSGKARSTHYSFRGERPDTSRRPPHRRMSSPSRRAALAACPCGWLRQLELIDHRDGCGYRGHVTIVFGGDGNAEAGAEERPDREVPRLRAWRRCVPGERHESQSSVSSPADRYRMGGHRLRRGSHRPRKLTPSLRRCLPRIGQGRVGSRGESRTRGARARFGDATAIGASD